MKIQYLKAFAPDPRNTILFAGYQIGQPYLTIHAESPRELAYARAYAEAQENLISLQEV
ncbi:hypothetical protein V8G57_21795 [Collimonas sp. H4R21]|jgi:hypothetical protein|uniref:Uncharacterized protein n=1 Tax=Collimonas rhizosphaerae TaxID=3126357 RepID=A0ABU9Q1H5_9BURK